MQAERQVSVWFPDIKILEQIRKIAKETNRGIGYVICEKWKEFQKETDMPEMRERNDSGGK